MDNFKQASKIALRFQTNKGLLSVEQLWHLNQTDLSDAIKNVKKIIKKTDDDELSFLESAGVTDVENQLRFDLLKDVYLTKKAEKEEIQNAAAIKTHNQKIIELITEKKENKLRDMSVEELEKLLK